MTSKDLFALSDHYKRQANCERGEKNHSVIFAMWLDAQAGFLEREAKKTAREEMNSTRRV